MLKTCGITLHHSPRPSATLHGPCPQPGTNPLSPAAERRCDAKVYRIRELIADGATSTQIRRIRGELAPLTWGVYVNHDLDPWERYRLQCLETVSRLKAGAALTGPSAAAVRETAMLGGPPARVYVSNVCPGRYAPGIRVLPPVPTSDYNGILLSDPAAMLGHCTWVLDARESLVVADSALAMGLCQPAELRQWAQAHSGKKHAGRMRWLAENVDPQSDSPGETLTRLAVTGLGYDVVSQFRVELTDRLAFIDLLIEGTKVAIEFDGLIKYRKRGLAKVVQEHLREGELQVLGYTIVRLIWQQLDDEEQLDRRLRAAGARPTRRRRRLPW